MKKLTLLAFALPLLVLGCDTTPNELENASLSLSFSGLEPLDNGFHYEGWAIVGGSALTTGKFNVDANGALVNLDGTAIAGGGFELDTDIGEASAIVLTIEPAGDTDTVPASTHVVSGPVTNGSANLTVGHSAALGDDFTGAAGSYILATPTDDDASNETSGIWFLDNSSGSAQPGLTLPTLPAGWAYEGWVVIDGTPVSTGTFTDVAAADDSRVFSGDNPGPNYPGEDFIVDASGKFTFPTDLSGRTAVISIEPSPDDSPAPYTLKPLAGPIPTDALDHTVYSIDQNLGSFPTGSATIR